MAGRSQPPREAAGVQLDVLDSGCCGLADGFSCRTQISAGHLGRQGTHLAELLASLLRQ
jgi:Fe-S oxidoreductase